MAVEYIAWALKQKVNNPTAKIILISLANYAGKNGTCYPGQSTLADLAEVSDRSVRTAIKHLEKLGLVSRKKRGKKGGGRSSDLFVLNLTETKAENSSGKGGKAEAGFHIKPEVAASRDINRQGEPSDNKTPIIPNWLDEDLWEEYKSHLKELGKRLSSTAEYRQIKQLDEWRGRGHDPEAIINQSLNNNWTRLFEPKEETHATTRRHHQAGPIQSRPNSYAQRTGQGAYEAVQAIIRRREDQTNRYLHS